MPQLLLHLIGDYLLQSHDMATKKTSKAWWCWYHCVVYTAPFLLLTRSPLALGIIFISHFFIDHYRLARYVVRLKNQLLGNGSQFEFMGLYHINHKTYDTPTGYPKETPDYLAVWLLIIADNTLHLAINYLALTHA